MSTLPKIEPIQLKKEPDAFDRKGWVFELKYDGFRALAYLEAGTCRLVSRNGNDFARFPTLARRLAEHLELRNAILERPGQFVQTLTEKLMTYGLGRSLTYRDMPTVRRIVRQAEAADYAFSAIVLGIASSDQFRLARLPGSAVASADVAIGEPEE